jgi:hypothetical protein
MCMKSIGQHGKLQGCEQSVLMKSSFRWVLAQIGHRPAVDKLLSADYE